MSALKKDRKKKGAKRWFWVQLPDDTFWLCWKRSSRATVTHTKAFLGSLFEVNSGSAVCPVAEGFHLCAQSHRLWLCPSFLLRAPSRAETSALHCQGGRFALRILRLSLTNINITVQCGRWWKCKSVHMCKSLQDTGRIKILQGSCIPWISSLNSCRSGSKSSILNCFQPLTLWAD